MRIVIHDLAGHAFPVDLSRELAVRGHEVLHLYCASFVSPRGAVSFLEGDPPTLRIEGLSIGREFNKRAPKQRLFDEWAYGRALAARAATFRPDVVLSTGTALLSQLCLLREARRTSRRFLYWWQDSYGVGIASVVHRRSRLLAPLVAWPFQTLERRLLARSDKVIAISEGMRHVALGWGIDSDKLEVIPNWALVNHVVPGRSENSWKTAHGLTGAPLILYAGTLGLKHDPELLVALAAQGQSDGFRVAVISEGPGREFLEKRRRELQLQNLTLLDYQPAETLPQVLAAANVLIVILEPDAGAFSVPSKIFSYLCAGRPILAALPSDNQAAEVLKAADAGICVPPSDAGKLCAAAKELLRDPERCEQLGVNARRYATEHFDRSIIADRFEILFGSSRLKARAK